MSIPEPNLDPEGLPDLRAELEAIRPNPTRFMELRGIALQLCDDLAAAYDRLGVLYERLDPDEVELAIDGGEAGRR